MHSSKIKIPEKTANSVTDLALDTIEAKKQAIIFVGTKKGAEKTAEDIAKKIKTTNAELEELSDKIINALPKSTKQCERLSQIIKKGIAFHHAGLVAKQKELIEDNFRKGTIRIICCTPTLAAGVDLPAFRTIIKDLKRYGKRGYDYITVLEYEQMGGRAGRPKFDTFGESISISSSDNEKETIKERFINGVPEEIFSKLAAEPVLRTYLLSLIAAEFVTTKKQIMEFFKKTFWAHQYKDMKHLQGIINKMLKLLEEYNFITLNELDFISANEIDTKDKVTATPLGKRVAELYLDPLTADHIIQCLKKAASRKTKPAEIALLQMITHTLELRPLLTVKVKEWEEIQQKTGEIEEELLEEEPSAFEEDYDEFAASVKTAVLFEEWIEEKDEEFLLEKYSVRPGELHTKLSLADWLLYSAAELARILKMHPLIVELAKLRMRINYGAKEELLPLLKLQNIGRARARKMFSSGIKDIAAVKKAELSSLASILGKNIAIDIKKQVGQDFAKEIVPENKRKGQISLKDY